MPLVLFLLLQLLLQSKHLLIFFLLKNKKPSKAVITGIAAKQSKVTAAVVLVIDHINVIIAVPNPIPPIKPDQPILK